jgi:hypothetical protein
MLFLLDSLGKLSLVDTFVLVLMMVFLFRLSQHKFPDKQGDSQREMTWLFSGLIVAVMTLALVFLSIGMVTKSFIFEVGGLARMLLGDNKRKAYSLLTLGSSLPQSVQDPWSSLGITCLQTAYYFYLVIMPFTCLAALRLLFLMPLTLPCQKRMQCMERLFALSIIASLFEISTFASFLVGHKCDLINEFLANHFDDNTCYTVKSSVESNVWYLICGAHLNSLTVSFLRKVAHHAVNERLERQGNLNKDVLAHDDVASHDLVVILLYSRFHGLFFDKSSAGSTNIEQSEENARRNLEILERMERNLLPRDLGLCHQSVHDKVASHDLDVMLLHSRFGGLLFEKVVSCY